MRIGLHVGFGDPLGRDLLRELRGHGIELARISANRSTDGFPAVTADELRGLIDEVRDAELDPLVIIRDAAQVEQIPEGIDIEMGNEPNMAINGWREGNNGNPRLPSYVDMALRAVDVTNGRNPLWIACPRGLHRNGFAFLRMIPWARVPQTVGCSFHRYPVGNKGPQASENRSVGGFLLNKYFGTQWTREQEMDELRRIVGNKRPLGLSEVGYNRLDYPSEEVVANNLARERSFFERQGVNFAVAYQINSGDPNSRHSDDHYGFREPNAGPWRPCLRAWCG